MAAEIAADVVVAHNGSFYMVWAVTEPAKLWLEENVQEDAQWLGPRLYVDGRYIEGLVALLQEAGFTVR